MSWRRRRQGRDHCARRGKARRHRGGWRHARRRGAAAVRRQRARLPRGAGRPAAARAADAGRSCDGRAHRRPVCLRRDTGRDLRGIRTGDRGTGAGRPRGRIGRRHRADAGTPGGDAPASGESHAGPILRRAASRPPAKTSTPSSTSTCLAPSARPRPPAARCRSCSSPMAAWSPSAAACRSRPDRSTGGMANGVYPIHFVWETGLFEILKQLLTGAGGRAVSRDVWDWTTDPAIELLARPGGAGRLGWDEAQRGTLVGRRRRRTVPGVEAKDFCKARPGAVELHAVGHSAGAIFHAHFVRAALERGLPAFRSVHLLAPAVNVETFLDRTAPLVANGIDHLTVYTMSRRHEEADHCFHVYRKSLLYLVSHAFERSLRTPILGLERALRGDPKLTRLFGLDGRPSSVAEVVWSPTAATTGRSASTSTTHGGFDDDAPTMNSVLRRVLGLDDAMPIVEFPSGARAVRDFWEETPDPDRDALLALLGRPTTTGNASPWSASPAASPPAVDAEPGRPGRHARAVRRRQHLPHCPAVRVRGRRAAVEEESRVARVLRGPGHGPRGHAGDDPRPAGRAREGRAAWRRARVPVLGSWHAGAGRLGRRDRPQGRGVVPCGLRQRAADHRRRPCADHAGAWRRT